MAPAAAPPRAPLHVPLQAAYGPQPQCGHQLGLPPPPAVWGAGSRGQLFFPPAPAGGPTIWSRTTKARHFPGHGDRSVSPKPSTAAEGGAVLPQGGWPARGARTEQEEEPATEVGGETKSWGHEPILVPDRTLPPCPLTHSESKSFPFSWAERPLSSGTCCSPLHVGSGRAAAGPRGGRMTQREPLSTACGDVVAMSTSLEGTKTTRLTPNKGREERPHCRETPSSCILLLSASVWSHRLVKPLALCGTCDLGSCLLSLRAPTDTARCVVPDPRLQTTAGQAVPGTQKPLGISWLGESTSRPD